MATADDNREAMELQQMAIQLTSGIAGVVALAAAISATVSVASLACWHRPAEAAVMLAVSVATGWVIVSMLRRS